MIAFASYFWMIASFINMFVFIGMAVKTRKLYHVLYTLMWICTGLWGMTIMAINIEWVKEFNGIVLPIAAGTFGLVGGIMRLVEAIKEKHI